MTDNIEINQIRKLHSRSKKYFLVILEVPDNPSPFDLAYIKWINRLSNSINEYEYKSINWILYYTNLHEG
jgi:hypothetical protein